MEKTNIYKYYELGKLLNEFSNFDEITNVQLYNNLARFFDFVDELNLHVTDAAIKLNGLPKLYKNLNELCNTIPRKPCEKTLVKKVINSVKKIIVTFESEIYNRHCYILSEKKIPLKILIDNVPALFNNEDVILDAPFDVKYHINEASQCLAFDRYTGCCLHMLLAVEEYIRFLNQKFNTTIDENSTFFTLIKNLEEVLAWKNSSKELIALLHIIRKNYRNETQHSNKKFVESEAVDLFNLCIKVINQMHKLLKEIV